jgi:hypothetical protein
MSGNDRTCPDEIHGLPNEPTPAEVLSPPQLDAIELLMRGFTFAKTARRLGVDPRTIHRWRNDRNFLAEIHRQINAAEARGRERAAAHSTPTTVEGA